LDHHAGGAGFATLRLPNDVLKVFSNGWVVNRRIALSKGLAIADCREFVLNLSDRMAIIGLLDQLELVVPLIIQLILMLFELVFVADLDGLGARTTIKPFKLKDKFIDFLSASADMTLCLIRIHGQFVKLFLELTDLHIL